MEVDGAFSSDDDDEYLDTRETTDKVNDLDSAFGDKKIVQMKERKNASMAGSTQKERSDFVSDKKLKDLLVTADEITSLEHFMYWKDEFLFNFRGYLNPDETATAREADETLYVRMQKLAKICLKLKELHAAGSIAKEGSTVSGQKAINEFVAILAKAEKQLHAYFPKTKEDEEIAGYNKFNLAAVLVRDGFRVYGLLVTTRDYIVKLRDGPFRDGILKSNHKSIIQFYLNEVETFCDTMADLGIYKVMNKCVELYKVRPRKKKKKKFDRETMDPLSDTSDDEMINNGRLFRKAKTNFKSIMDHGWTSGVSGREVRDPFAESAEKELSSPTMSTPAKTETKEDEPDPQKPEDWIYYYDPDTDIIGKIPRQRALGENFIIRYDQDMKEHHDAAIKEWDGEEGKKEMIWKLKDACKGKGKKKQSKK